MRVACFVELPQWCGVEMRSVDSIIHRLSIFHNQLGPVSLWQLIVVQCFIQNPSQEGGLAPTISRTACWTILWWNVLIDFYWLSQYCIQTITGGAITIKMTAIFEPVAFNFIFNCFFYIHLKNCNTYCIYVQLYFLITIYQYNTTGNGSQGARDNVAINIKTCKGIKV